MSGMGWTRELELARYECRCLQVPPEGTFYNARLACKALQDIVLQPGQTLSFNRQMNKVRSYFKPGLTVSGKSTILSRGGGICQVATGLFHAAILGKLQIRERHEHSNFVKAIDYCREGEDAAVSMPHKDLKIRNHWPFAVRIQARSDGDTGVILTLYEIKGVKSPL